MEAIRERKELDVRTAYAEHIADKHPDSPPAVKARELMVGAFVHNEMGDKAASDRMAEDGWMNVRLYEAGVGDLDAPDTRAGDFSTGRKIEEEIKQRLQSEVGGGTSGAQLASPSAHRNRTERSKR